VLAAFYYLVLTPYGLVRRRVRDPLTRRWDPAADSYFVVPAGLGRAR
jgi:hypothetical protein